MNFDQFKTKYLNTKTVKNLENYVTVYKMLMNNNNPLWEKYNLSYGCSNTRYWIMMITLREDNSIVFNESLGASSREAFIEALKKINDFATGEIKTNRFLRKMYNNMKKIYSPRENINILMRETEHYNNMNSIYLPCFDVNREEPLVPLNQLTEAEEVECDG